MNQPKNILILGSLPGNDQKKIDLYEAVTQACQNIGSEFLIDSPISTQNFTGDVFERRERGLKKIAEADLIIGDQTSPSTGQGIEIRQAEILSKSFIAIAETGSKISGRVESSPSLQKVIFYDSIEDVRMKLMDALKTLEF